METGESQKLCVGMAAVIVACLLFHFLAVDAACDAYLKYAPPDSQRYPCIFPFKFGNKTFDNECALVNAVPPYMVCPVDLDPPRRKIVREGICECGVGETCPELQTSSEASHRTLIFHNFKHELVCEWNTNTRALVSTNATLKPATVVVFTRLAVDGDLVLLEGRDKRKILRETDPSTAVWTREDDLWITLHTGAVATGRKNMFSADIYTGFCSHYDGTINLTSSLQLTPYAPIISSNYNYPIGVNYRPESYCTWEIKLGPPETFSVMLDDSPSNRNDAAALLFSMYFSFFDLGKGDTVLVSEEFGLGTLKPSMLHSFDENTPPSPIYTTAKSLRVVFQSDGRDEKLGFSAELFQNSCSKRTVALNGLAGTIRDGSPTGYPYQSNLDCSWTISHPYPKSRIAITVKTLNFIQKSDALIAYDNARLDSNIIHAFTGSILNETTVWSKSNKIYLSFRTHNASKRTAEIGLGVDYGFELSWKVCAEECLTCAAGTFYDFGKKTCEECPPFTYSKNGSLYCDACPPGTMWESSTKCVACPPGFYSTMGDCQPCPIGRVTLRANSSECEPCANSSYAVNNTCLPCKEAERQNAKGDACELIPVPMNMQSIIIYAVLTSVMLFIVIGILTYFQWKKSQPQGYDYQPLSMFDQ